MGIIWIYIENKPCHIQVSNTAAGQTSATTRRQKEESDNEYFRACRLDDFEWKKQVAAVVVVVRVRFQIIRNARIENLGKYQSCMVSKLRIIWKQTVPCCAQGRRAMHAIAVAICESPRKSPIKWTTLQLESPSRRRYLLSSCGRNDRSVGTHRP